jgi:agmatinase
LLGVPWDGGSTYQPGARLGPYHVRRVSALIQSYHPVHRLDVFSALRAIDGGNVAVSPFQRASTESMVQEEVAAILAAGASPFLVGGDHSIALPALRAIVQQHGPIALVHVDAHLDTSGAEVWGAEFHHGTPIRHAIEEGLIARDQLFQVGLRATWSSPEDGAVAADHGAKMFGMTELSARGVRAVATEIRETIGGRPTYVSFDIDAIDPAFAPGTGTPVAGGLSSREAIELMRGLSGVAMVGMDVVEVVPQLDHSDITAHLAAQILFEGLAITARHVCAAPRTMRT